MTRRLLFLALSLALALPLTAADKTLHQYTELTSAAVDDEIGIWDLSAAAMKKITLTNLGAVIGGGTWASISGKPTTLLGYGITDAQGLDSDLTAIAALSTATFGRSLLTESSAANTRTTLGLAIGTNVQAYSSRLGALASGFNSSSIYQFEVGGGLAFQSIGAAGISIDSGGVITLYEGGELRLNTATVNLNEDVTIQAGSVDLESSVLATGAAGAFAALPYGATGAAVLAASTAAEAQATVGVGARINVADLATGGNGTSGSPWTGWDTALVKASNTTYFFRKGYYSGESLLFEAGPGTSLTMKNITLQGEPGTFLTLTGKATASGTNNIFPARTAVGFGSSERSTAELYDRVCQNIFINDLVIDGGATARVGIFFLAAWQIGGRDFSVRNLASGSAVTGVAVASGTNPTFTKTAHGFTVGQIIKITGMSGAGSTSVNGTCWQIDTVPTANTFTVGASCITTGAGTSATVRLASVGLDICGSLGSTFTNYTCSYDLWHVTTGTDVGIVIRPDREVFGDWGLWPTSHNFIAPRIEQVVDAILLAKSSSNTFIGGIIGTNTGWGVKILNHVDAGQPAAPYDNTFVGTDIENNTLGDVLDRPGYLGSSNSFINCVTALVTSDAYSVGLTLKDGAVSSRSSLVLNSGSTAADQVILKATNSALGQQLSVNAHYDAAGCYTVLPQADGFVGYLFGGDRGLYYSGSNYHIGTNFTDAAGDINLMNASSKNINFAIGGVGVFRLSGVEAAFHKPARFLNLTKTQRDALTGKTVGIAIYQTDNTPGLRVWNGTNWMRYTETAD